MICFELSFDLKPSLIENQFDIDCGKLLVYQSHAFWLRSIFYLLHKAEKPSACLSTLQDNLSGFCMDRLDYGWLKFLRRAWMYFQVSKSSLQGIGAPKRS